ncbi:MAG: protein-glutamate O-methyltransferase CheR [Desulfamplus sp.]|nr:protein-glutamate O-methyltransferase CheR [Desulfamplus sp.]MBF0390723.1 protein-glutamate O-methyltransferase CheR [Desulfamplus sp.]
MAALSMTEFENLSSFVYRKTGIRFESKKIYFISKRVQKRMQSLGVQTIDEYIRLLRFADLKGAEFQNLVDLLTVNETYFFRDFPQLQAFAEHCLPEIAKAKVDQGKYNLRIWSAPCSTGEEPYTLGIIMHTMLDNVKQWDIQILASDIDRNVLENARLGIYAERSIRDVPPEYLNAYFKTTSKGDYRINSDVKKMVRFEHLNLSDKDIVRDKKGFDFIFCRNLLIYFDDLSRKQLVDHFYLALNPGGFLFLGSSESVGRISTAFKMKRAGSHLVYYKD